MAPATGTFFAPPSWSHLFGTDATGGDIFSRTLAATHTDVGITLAVVALALVVGTLWGSLIGFYGGWLDALTLRILQVMNSFPALLLAMLVISAMGRGILDVILVVALIPLPDYVRLARAEVMTKKTWQFAEAARMIGQRRNGVLFRHLVPNSTRPLLAYAGINASWVIATVGALGFLGLGIQPGSAEWGSMIAGGESTIVNGQWWISFFPGLGHLPPGRRLPPDRRRTRRRRPGPTVLDAAMTDSQEVPVPSDSILSIHRPAPAGSRPHPGNSDRHSTTSRSPSAGPR